METNQTISNDQHDRGQTTDDQFEDDCQSWLCCFCMQPSPAS